MWLGVCISVHYSTMGVDERVVGKGRPKNDESVKQVPVLVGQVRPSGDSGGTGLRVQSPE